MLTRKKQVAKILLAKEKHYQLRQKLYQKYHLGTLTVNLNIPGVNKTNNLYKQFFINLVMPMLNHFLLTQQISIVKKILKYDKTGHYLILIIKKNDYQQLKQQLIILETTNTILQFVDFDIYDDNNNSISRQQFNAPLRKCYLCQKASKWCAQQQTHHLSELLSYINKKMTIALENLSK